MIYLALETSCDETSVAVFTHERKILSNVVASQHEFHARFGGVVPEIAGRAHLRQLWPVLHSALAQAQVTINQISAVAVHASPGLVGALLVGVSAAKMLAATLEVPLIAVNHVAAHVYACRLAAEQEIFPCLGFIISGGHTCLVRAESPLSLELLGTTRDDAAGEAFDKVAAMLGLGFPGGPALERYAKSGDPQAYDFPRAFGQDGRLEFSFSGLKTAVLYAARGQNAQGPPRTLTETEKANLAASFQAAVVDVLVLKAKQALRVTGYRRLAIGGGVVANQSLRQGFEAMATKLGVELIIPPRELCTDNAAMAALAIELHQAGQIAPPDLDAEPQMQWSLR